MTSQFYKDNLIKQLRGQVIINDPTKRITVDGKSSGVKYCRTCKMYTPYARGAAVAMCGLCGSEYNK